MTSLQLIVNQIICLSTTLSLENVQNERRKTTESIFASIHSLLLIDAVGMSYSLFRIEFYFLIEESLKSPLFCFAHCVGVLILKTQSCARCQKNSRAQIRVINYFQRGRVPEIIRKFIMSMQYSPQTPLFTFQYFSVPLHVSHFWIFLVQNTKKKYFKN